VHNCGDDYFTFLETVVHNIGESMDQSSSDALIDDSKSFRHPDDPPEDLIDCPEELIAESLLLLLVVGPRIGQIRL